MNLARTGVMRVAMAGLIIGVIAALPRLAEACGCFAPPDPTVPVVQAGERILFSRQGGVVTAHIQIQYAGDAKDFGWLLPLPSVPVLELGTDELFTQLTRTTQPSYRLTTTFSDSCARPSFMDAAPGPDASPGTPGGNVVVLESSIGPYDYAVLEAGSRAAMLAWLKANHYFVPVGTEDVVGPYIHDGAYFLALKLRPGKSAGDLQPVVVRYASDLPMIPIILTSVAAQPDMAIQVWMLGQGRAIPRNYAHTVLNDATINWLGGGFNYPEVVIKATREAPRRHTFITEYAGSSQVMVGLLDGFGRFGSVAELATQTTVRDFLVYLNRNRYPVATTKVLALLTPHYPVPAGLAARGLTAAAFYTSISYWLDIWQPSHPEDFEGWAPDHDPAARAAELDAEIVRPTLAAAQLFRDHPYLTRLLTTLSPGDMTRDPVFSENRSLPDVSNIHRGTITYFCEPGRFPNASTPARLVTEQGWVIDYPRGTGAGTPALPFSRRIEAIGEEGGPETMLDNDAVIAAVLRGDVVASPDGGGTVVLDAGLAGRDAAVGRALGDSSCSVGGTGGAGNLLVWLLVALAPRRRFRS